MSLGTHQMGGLGTKLRKSLSHIFDQWLPSATMTFTNKTLTSPVIVGATVSGTIAAALITASDVVITDTDAAGGGSELTINSTFSASAVAAHKALNVLMTYGPTVGTACPIGICSKLTLDGDLTAANNYQGMGFGIQGQLHIATGSTLDGSTFGDTVGAMYCGVRGVITDSGTSTYTKGKLACLFADMQVTQNASVGADFKVYCLYNYVYNAAGNSNVDAVIAIDAHGSLAAGTIEKGIQIISTAPVTTGISLESTMSKGIDVTDATLTQGWNNGFFCCGSGNGSGGDQHSVTTTDFYIPIQVNMVSIANPSAPSHFTAAMLRTDVSTGDQAFTLCNPLAIRADIAYNVYGIEGINIDMKISDDIAVSTGVNSAYFQLTGDGAITNSAENQVLCAAYRGTNGSTGIDHVTQSQMNAPDCAVTNNLCVRQVQGTVTNMLNLRGTSTFGIKISATIPDALQLTAGSEGTSCCFTNVATPAVNTSHALRVDIDGTEHYIPIYSDLSWDAGE